MKLFTQYNTIKSLIDAVKAKSDNLPVDPADQSDLSALLTTIDSVVDAIKAKTDNLPTDPADHSDLSALLTTIDSVVDAIKAKTDNLPIDPADQSAIEALFNAVMAELEEICSHFHNMERWYGKKAVPNAEVNIMDNVLTPFQIDSGNNAYGTGVLVIGSGDTPARVGKTKFDMHEILIVNTERTNEPYKIRVTWGNSEAEGIAAGNYSTTMIYPAVTLRQIPQSIMMPRLNSGTKVWVNCWCANNTGTIDFFIGIHEYDV